jgi:hypothetical protein
MNALARFVEWMRNYEHVDRTHRLPAGLKVQYHPRSPRSSKELAEFVVDDLLAACPVLAEHARQGDVAYAIDKKYRWSNGKTKKLDIALGIPEQNYGPPTNGIRRIDSPGAILDRLLIGIEQKAVMTEHGKSQPRIYSELNDSHVIVHQGDPWAIAAGLTVVNIANTFVSPLRQAPGRPIHITQHSQPHVATNMVHHLRGLPIRDSVDGVGFDAYCTFIMNVNNQGHVELHTHSPAPQIGDQDHYATFLRSISEQYSNRFSDLDSLPENTDFSVEAKLLRLASQNPNLFTFVGDRIVEHDIPGGDELSRILRALDIAARGGSNS